MVGLPELWLPILLSAIVVFVASFLAWMALPHHKGDWKGVPDEESFLGAARSVPPGQYMFPYCGSQAQMKDPEFKKRMEAGPHGTMTVWPGPPAMGLNLVLTFIFYIVVGIFVAYLGTHALERGAEYLTVFRITGTAAIMAYVFGMIPNAIWMRKSLRSLVADVIDGIVYGLLTAGIFGWMWPAVAASGG